MGIIINLDVVMAQRKMGLTELSKKVDITMANLSILKNNKAKAIRFSTLEALCRAMGFQRVRVVDPYDLKAVGTAVKEELAVAEPSVIISRRPCALLKYVKHEAPLTVDPVKCVGCRSCMKIGCPAISIKEGKAHVDATLCVGCGVCEQMCGVKAFG